MKGTSFDVENVHCRVFCDVEAESFSVTAKLVELSLDICWFT